MPTPNPPPDQETVQLELAPLAYEAGTLTLGPLGRYWNEDRRQNMFRAISPDLSPESATIHTNDPPIVSPYEQKLMTMRPTTPKPTETDPPMLVVTTMSPIVTHALPQSVSQAPTWMPPTLTQPRTTAPVLRRIPTPPVRPPSPLMPCVPSPQLAQPPRLPAEGYDDPLQGREPSVFDGN